VCESDSLTRQSFLQKAHGVAIYSNFPINLKATSDSSPSFGITKSLWCTTPKHHHFQTTKIGHPDFLLFLIPLVEMLQLMRGLKLLEHLSKYAKLTELKNSP
jgi:hypothetical protein